MVTSVMVSNFFPTEIIVHYFNTLQLPVCTFDLDILALNSDKMTSLCLLGGMKEKNEREKKMQRGCSSKKYLISCCHRHVK